MWWFKSFFLKHRYVVDSMLQSLWYQSHHERSCLTYCYWFRTWLKQRLTIKYTLSWRAMEKANHDCKFLHFSTKIYEYVGFSNLVLFFIYSLLFWVVCMVIQQQVFVDFWFTPHLNATFSALLEHLISKTIYNWAAYIYFLKHTFKFNLKIC